MSLQLELRGVFDSQAARGLLATLREHVARGRILLDFSKVEVLHDFALASLVQGLSELPVPQLTTRGLRHHTSQLLRYLRMDPETLRPLPSGSRGAEPGVRRPPSPAYDED